MVTDSQCANSSVAAQIRPLPARSSLPSSDIEQMNRTASQVCGIARKTFSFEHNLAASGPLPGLHHCTNRKRGRKSTNTKHTDGDPSSSDANSLLNPGACRYESSLGLLTRKFVNMVHQFEDGVIDLNIIARKLELRKRRLYDITNVLEGIGLIEKTSKSLMRWKGFDSGPGSLDDQVTKLEDEVESLSAEEFRLDACIREKQELLSTLQEDERNRKHLFLSAADIMTLPCFQNQMVFAIKAPQASCVEVPDPDKDSCFSEKQYRIILRSSTGPIDIFFLSKTEDDHMDSDFKGADTINLDSFSSGLCREAESEIHASASHQKNVLPVDKLTLPGSDDYQIQQITPSDYYNDGREGDYWLQSDAEVSMTDLWGK